MNCVVSLSQNQLNDINARFDQQLGYPNGKTLTYGYVLEHPTLPLNYVLPLKNVYDSNDGRTVDPTDFLTTLEKLQIQDVAL